MMNEYETLAAAIFPDIKESIADLEKKYPPRQLEAGAEVTRFAPSPTGFLHTGGLCTALRDYKVAQDTNGIFYLRIEDTDQAREVTGTDDIVSRQLREFGVVPNEGYVDDTHEIGDYGPYKQSHRADIYKTVIKEMVARNLAYPCFCSEEELDAVRVIQNQRKERTGYYGDYAVCRKLTPEQALENIKAGKPYVIRFKSKGCHETSLPFHDEIKGDITVTQNDMDIVILKRDGLPTYHFAHLVDDHFMRTTTVIRGEEWLPSLPIHLELFDAVGFPRVKYAHTPVIMKIGENGTKRKLSKRHDPEAAVSYFLEQGYPVEALVDYLYTIADSSFEQWLLANPGVDTKEFRFHLTNAASDGALFDIEKIKNISQTILARKTGQELTDDAYSWAKQYNQDLFKLINRDPGYFTKIMSIEKDKPNPRKDYTTYGEIFEKIKFFYSDYYDALVLQGLPFEMVYGAPLLIKVLEDFLQVNNPNLSEEVWFNTCRDSAKALGFAGNKKEQKAEPEKYPYLVASYMEIVRIAITGRKNAPNLYYCLNIIKPEEIRRRIEGAIEILKTSK